MHKPMVVMLMIMMSTSRMMAMLFSMMTFAHERQNSIQTDTHSGQMSLTNATRQMIISITDDDHFNLSDDHFNGADDHFDHS